MKFIITFEPSKQSIKDHFISTGLTLGTATYEFPSSALSQAAREAILDAPLSDIGSTLLLSPSAHFARTSLEYTGTVRVSAPVLFEGLPPTVEQARVSLEAYLALAASLLPACEQLHAARQAEKAENDAEYQARCRAEKAARDEAAARITRRKQEFVVSRDQWIDTHGSERLKLAKKAGLLDESNSVYLDERIARDWPGWEWETTEQETKGIHNPSERALRALVSARADKPEDEIALVFVVCEPEDGEEAGEKFVALRTEFFDYPILYRVEE